MKKIYTFLSLTLIGSAAMAQPIITDANMPIIGDMPVRGVCSDVPNAATLNAETGANYSWDFSGLTEVSTATFDFIDPATSFWASDFTSSNICGVETDQDAYTFYSSSSSMLETDGYRVIVSTGDTAETTYTDGERILNLPATYGNTNTDAFVGTGTASAGTVSFASTGTLSYTIDGHGTLELPNATYQNVIRYKADRSETFTVTVPFPGSSTVTKEQWIWVSADYRFWLLLMETITDPIGGNSTTVWYQKAPIAVSPTSIANVSEEDFTVYPNPVAANGTLQLSRALSTNETIQLFDMQGRMVKSMNATASSVSLDGVNAGVYILKTNNAAGNAISTQKLIVQ